jgi:MscS family membrane protein
LKARHEILMSIIELAEELGVRFAFPTSTIHVEDLPGQDSLSPKYDTDQESLNKKVAAFIEKYKSNQQQN